jgi:uncharacterized membrane protein YfcA
MVVELAMIVTGFGAGIFGSLLGLGGGILIVPLLTLGFGLPLRVAVGVSLVSVIVTSSASAAVFLQRHAANLRLGMTLELFTASGAIAGGLLAYALDEQQLSGLFALLLLYVAVSMLRRREPGPSARAGGQGDATTAASEGADAPPTATVAVPTAVEDDADAPGAEGFVRGLSGPGYRIERFRLGIVGSVAAGVVSALFGVGGGIVKVPLMHLVMGVPLRVATATSNLMIGITASASAIIYLLRGGLDPYVSGPIAIGVFLGASAGSRIAHRVDVRILRVLFTVVLLYTAFEMIQRAFQ